MDITKFVYSLLSLSDLTNNELNLKSLLHKSRTTNPVPIQNASVVSVLNLDHHSLNSDPKTVVNRFSPSKLRYNISKVVIE